MSGQSSSEQMRRVIQHAADKLGAALDYEKTRSPSNRETVAALSYAIGVFDLLACYLVVTDAPDEAQS